MRGLLQAAVLVSLLAAGIAELDVGYDEEDDNQIIVASHFDNARISRAQGRQGVQQSQDLVVAALNLNPASPFNYQNEGTSSAGSVITGDLTIYNIWLGNWTEDDPVVQGINYLAENLGASAWYSTNRRYYYSNTSNPRDRQYVRGKIILGGSVFLPASALGALSVKDDFVNLIRKQIADGTVPLGTVYKPTAEPPAVAYMILPGNDLMASTAVKGGRMCVDACGWHSYSSWVPFPDQTGSIPRILFGFVGHPSQCDRLVPRANTCWMDQARAQLKGKLPNGRMLDSMASIYAHEIAEIVATPYTDSWIEKGSGGVLENADMCQWEYGDFPGSVSKAAAAGVSTGGQIFVDVDTGNWFNTIIGVRSYMIQQNWDWELQRCAMSAPALPVLEARESPPPSPDTPAPPLPPPPPRTPRIPLRKRPPSPPPPKVLVRKKKPPPLKAVSRAKQTTAPVTATPVDAAAPAAAASSEAPKKKSTGISKGQHGKKAKTKAKAKVAGKAT